MKYFLFFIVLFLLSGCDAFKLKDLGGYGEPCFENGLCEGALICIQNVCSEGVEDSDQSEESDQSDQSDQSNDSDDSDESDQSDESDDSDTVEKETCNFGELCWKVVPTQQTRCFSDTGHIDCPEPSESGFGQDGSYPPFNERTFENVNLSGTYFVHDTVTDLLWSKTTTDNLVSFSDAGTFCQALNNSGAGGKFNWRLPYLHELVSIVNFDAVNQPMTDGFYFPHIKKGKYWTLTKLGYENYYYVDFSGESQFYTDDSDTRQNYATCVSSDHTYDTELKFNRWNEIYSGTDTMVEDRLTGLEWQKVTDYSTRLWKDAVNYCESLTFAQKTDWRLPDVNELHSLATYENEPEQQTTFPGMGSDFYWTSTTNANTIENAWVVEFKYGILKPELQKEENINGIYTICVRNR